MDQQYERRIYKIPRNVITSGKAFNGTIEKRNAAEAVVLFLLGFFICQFIHVPPEKVFTKYVYICGPLVMLGLSGIQGLPVSTYVSGMLHWARNRKPRFRNPHAKAYDTTYADLVLAEPQLGNMISDALVKIKDKYTPEKEYIEGETYQFMQDPSWAYLEAGTKKPEEEKKTQEPELDLSDLMSADFSGKE